MSENYLPTSILSHGGFTTASGKAVKYSEESLKKTKQLFDEIDLEYQDIDDENKEDDSTFVSSQDLTVPTSFFDVSDGEFDIDEEDKIDQKNSSPVKKKIKISENIIETTNGMTQEILDCTRALIEDELQAMSDVEEDDEDAGNKIKIKIQCETEKFNETNETQSSQNGTEKTNLTNLIKETKIESIDNSGSDTNENHPLSQNNLSSSPNLSPILKRRIVPSMNLELAKQ